MFEKVAHYRNYKNATIGAIYMGHLGPGKLCKEYEDLADSADFFEKIELKFKGYKNLLRLEQIDNEHL